MKKWILILSFFPFLIFGQAKLEWFESSNSNMYLPVPDFNIHTSIRPMLQSNWSFRPLTEFKIDSSQFYVSEFFGKHYASALKILPPKKWSLMPLLDAGARLENTFQYRAMAGLGVEANFRRKWYARMTYMHGIELATDFFQGKHTISLPIDSVLNQKIDIRGRISYTPNKFVNLQAGWDNNFIGEGSRSLLLGDYGKPYGFGQARLNFWRVEYLMLYQFMNEKNDQNQNVRKFAASHYLSYNVTKWLHLGLFESVVFQPKDTTLNRGFEPEYLNPMILYRPQEYAMGSSDNSLIGVDATIRIKKMTFYGQLMLDEFNLPDIKGRTRWWANKYAIQMGMKTNLKLKSGSLFLRGEMNIVRPYTYSHLSLGQSYTNQGKVLAHPYGANFTEILAESFWKKGLWKAHVFASYSLKGFDKNGENWGGNIFIPYVNRPVELGDFGHTIGQGKGNNAFRVMLRGAYTLFPEIRMDAFVEAHYRYNTYLNEPQGQILIGIRSQLWNDYRNY